MDEETKVRIEELDKRFSSLEKRFDDIKWYFGGITALFTIGFSVFTLVSSWNYSSERDSLRDFKNELRAEVGKVEPPPELHILTVDNNPLSGQEIPVTIQTKQDGAKDIVVSFSLRNAGGSPTGPMYVKFYSNDPIQFRSESSDEKPRFEYESYIDPNDFELSEIPSSLL